MFLGLDLGTSGVKALLIDDAQRSVAAGRAGLTVSRRFDGWSEQEPEHWIAACEQAIAQIWQVAPEAWAALKGIGVSGQMHGATLLDATDRPLRPAILWNDGRSGRECAELEARADFRGIAGNAVMAGFTAPKLAWVRRHEPEIFSKIVKILLPKDYVNLWLTGEHVSEMSDAAGTLWLDTGARCWSEPLLEATGLGVQHMPRLVEGSEQAGRLRPALAEAWGIGQIPVAGGAGDNAATACGLGITRPGTGFVSIGTSGVLFAATERFVPNVEQGVHSFCHAVPDTWHQMGVILAAADSLEWLATLTGQTAEELSNLVTTPVTAPIDILFLPYLSGERTPHNAPNATGLFSGLRRQHGPADLAQAVMQGVAFAFADCLAALRAAGTELDEVWLAGGGSQSAPWLTMIAAATGLRLLEPEDGEIGAARGAARLAMLAAGHDTLDAVMQSPGIRRRILPQVELRDAFAASGKAYRAAAKAHLGADRSRPHSNRHGNQ